MRGIFDISESPPLSTDISLYEAHKPSRGVEVKFLTQPQRLPAEVCRYCLAFLISLWGLRVVPFWNLQVWGSFLADLSALCANIQQVRTDADFVWNELPRRNTQAGALVVIILQNVLKGLFCKAPLWAAKMQLQCFYKLRSDPPLTGEPL